MKSMVEEKAREGERTRKGIRHLLGRREHLASASPHHWYSRRKRAAKEVKELSDGKLELVSSVYRGSRHRHEFVHTPCGRSIWSTMAEIRAKGAGVCPHCHQAEILASFGRMEDVQRYVMETSGNMAYFFANNPIGSDSRMYDFFCFLHGPFRTTFGTFLKNRGETNGCPRCESPGHSGERHGNVIFL